MLKRSKFVVIGVMTMLLALFPLACSSSDEEEKTPVQATPVEELSPADEVAEEVSPAPATKPWGGIKQVRVLGGPSGSGAYMMGQILAKHFDTIPDITSIGLAGVSAKNLLAIEAGEGEWAYSDSVNFQWAADAVGPFEGQSIEHVAFTCHAFSRIIGFFVRADSDISSIEDMKSKHIGVGPKGLAANAPALAILEAYDITPDTIGQWGGRISYLSHADIVAGLQDKTIDVHCVTVTGRSVYASHVPLEETFGLRVIEADADHLAKARELHPYLITGSMKAGVYKNLEEDYDSLGTSIFFFCSSELPEDLVYEILSATYSEACQNDLFNLSPDLEMFVENGLVGAEGYPYPPHPGAIKYFEEQGTQFLEGEIPVVSQFSE